MDQKPVIQYVGQFYVYGSEVKAPKKKQQSAKVFLPKKPKTGKERRIYADCFSNVASTYIIVNGQKVFVR